MANLGVYILTEDKDNKRSTELVHHLTPSVKNASQSIRKVKVRIPEDVENLGNRHAKEKYVNNILLTDSNKRHSNDYTLIVKSDSVANCSHEQFKRCVQEIIKTGNCDVCYLGRWESYCPLNDSTALSGRHALLKLPGPSDNVTATLYSPKGRAAYLENKDLNYGAVVPSLFVYDPLMAISQNNMGYLNDCQSTSEAESATDFGIYFILLAILIFGLIFLFIYIFGRK